MIRKILKKFSKNSVFATLLVLSIFSIFALLGSNIIKYINFNINFFLLYEEYPELVWLFSVTIFIGFSISCFSKIYLKLTERTLIIQDGKDGKEIPLNVMCKLYENKRIKITITNETKKEIDNKISILLNEFEKIKNSNENGKYLYCGISYIPFVYMLGSLYGDQGVDFKFCQIDRRSGKNEINIFKDKNKKEKIELNSNYINNDSDELLVTIGLSFDVDEYMDNNFKTMSRLYINTPKPARELLLTNYDIKFAVDYVTEKIRKVQNSYKKVHLFISASTAFIFRLGMEYSKPYDKVIVVYHFDNKNQHNRPWGIEIASDNNYSAVVIKK